MMSTARPSEILPFNIGCISLPTDYATMGAFFGTRKKCTRITFPNNLSRGEYIMNNFSTKFNGWEIMENEYFLCCYYFRAIN